jgi:hypothetical protein
VDSDEPVQWAVKSTPQREQQKIVGEGKIRKAAARSFK